MIDKNKIYKNYVQHSNSCILASYAIASNYFTDILIENFFRDYCLHFNLVLNDEINRYFASILYQPENSTLPEFLYEFHFQREFRRRQITGLKLMEQIHHESNEYSFVQSKNIIEIETIDNVIYEQARIETTLKNESSLLVSAINNGNHIAVFGYTELKWFTIETRRYVIVSTPNGQIRQANTTGLIEISNLNYLGPLSDALLIKENV